jgi:hypothetical protein
MVQKLLLADDTFAVIDEVVEQVIGPCAKGDGPPAACQRALRGPELELPEPVDPHRDLPRKRRFALD